MFVNEHINLYILCYHLCVVIFKLTNIKLNIIHPILSFLFFSMNTYYPEILKLKYFCITTKSF